MINTPPTPITIASVAEPPATTGSERLILEEALPASDAKLENIALPKHASAVVDVVGSGSKDIWLLSGWSRSVMHYDGRRTRLVAKPNCFTQEVRDPSWDGQGARRTTKLYVRPDAMVLSDKGGVDVYGTHTLVVRGAIHSVRRMHVAKSGRYACNGSDELTYGMVTNVAASGDAHWIAACHFRCNIMSTGRPLLIGDTMWMHEPVVALVMHGPQWGFIAQEHQLLELDGASWRVHPPPVPKIKGMWGDDDGALWVLGDGRVAFRHGQGRKDQGRKDQGRKDQGRKDQGWKELPLPKDFKASHIGGSSPDNLWFVGGDTWYHLDHGRLKKAKAAIPKVDVVRSVGAEVWIGGHDPTASDKGLALRIR